MFPISRRGTLLTLGAATLAACSREGSTKEDPVDLSATEEAVRAASARVVKVLQSKRQVDGLGHAISMELRMDSAEPVSSEDLGAIVKAIWTTVPWEPNGIRLMAVADDARQEPVDLRTGAEALKPAFAAPFRAGGISLVGMSKRYGAWKKPA